MYILAFLAVVGHILLGYHWMFKPAYNNIKTLQAQNGIERVPIFLQEKAAFIFLPLLGYVAFIFLKEFDSEHVFSDLPAIIILQAVSFGLYFYSRSKLRPSSIFEIIFIPSMLVLGIASCAILIIKLFFYYLICITLGWIFVILPLCMMAYYALFQVIAFQITELIKILKFARGALADQGNANFPKGFALFYFGKMYWVAQLVTFAIVIISFYALLHYVDLGAFSMNIETLLSPPKNHFF